MAPDTRLLDEAWAALDEGEPEEALDLVHRLPDADPARAVLEAAARVELRELDEAGRRLADARRLGIDAEDPDLLWTEGQLHLSAWEVQKARESFERLATQDRSVAVLERLALCADLQGDERTAKRLLDEATALDATQFPPVPRLTVDAFGRVVEEAIAALPDGFRAALDVAHVIVDPMPTRELAFAGDPTEIDPEILGLFSGESYLDRGHDGAPALPPTIHLFQRNLERLSRDVDQLREEIRVTLYHELGHLLGFDEDGVDRMGLG